MSWLKLIVLWSSLQTPLHAEGWFGKFTTGAYLGRYTLGLGYSFKDHHDFSLSIGQTPAFDELVLYQANLEYRFNALKDVPTKWDNWTWRPLQFYLTLLYIFNDEFFFMSPDRYPVGNYYEPTTYALTAGAGSEFRFPVESRTFSFIWWINVSEQYIKSKINNVQWHTQFCCSSGVGMKMDL